MKRVRHAAGSLVLAAAVGGLVWLCVWYTRTPPSRDPNVSGTVLQVEPPGKKGFRFQLRPTGSDRPRWVIVEPTTQIRRADGSAGTVAPGQTVRAWGNRAQTLNPPILIADFVLIESDGP